MGRLRRGGAERIGRHVADIGIGFELAPRPALVAILEDGEGLAEQRLAFQPGIRTRVAPDRRRRGDDPARRPLDEAGGLDPALEAGVGEVGTERMETGIEVGHGGR